MNKATSSKLKLNNIEKKVSVLNVFKDNWGVFLIVFILWSVFSLGAILISMEPSMTLGSMGTFGDSFNVLTSLFTGLAFAGVIVSVILQTTELKEAREQFKRQADSLELQQVDNKFFQMLDELNNLIGRLEYKDGPSQSKGVGVFKMLSEKLDQKLQKKENYIEDFKIFNEVNDTNLKYYFINLYQLLKYVSTNLEVKENDKENIEKVKNIKKQEREYTNIIRAQQTKYQLKLLFFNCISIRTFSGNNYKKMVEEYALFEHMSYSNLLSIAEENHLFKDRKALEDKYIRVEEYNNGTIEANGKKKIPYYKDNYILVDSLLIEYKKEAFGKNEDLIAIWENRKKLIDID